MKLLALTLLLVTSVALPPPAGALTKPDVIVVMVDDMGAIDERVLSRLPNMKSLWLDGGLRFDGAFSHTPLCCPSRATFLTGQYTRTHGVTTNGSTVAKLDVSQTVATAMNGAGYWTFMAGKYLNSAGQVDNTPPGWDRVAILRDWTDQTSRFTVQGQWVSAGYRDRFTATKAEAWLRVVPAGRPVFAWINPHAPHAYGGNVWKPSVEPRYVGDPRCSGIAPWRPPDYAYDRMPDGLPLARICRSLLTVDDMVGRLRAEATRQGRTPIWLLTSDNGMSWGRKGYPKKNVPWADRFPLYVAGPGIAAGVTAALVSSYDLGPTIADLGGASMPRAEGLSFAPLLAGQSGGRPFVYQDHPVGGDDGTGGSTGPWWSIRTSESRLVEGKTTRLFDLLADPWEETNVASLYPDKVAELRSLRP